VLPNMEAGCSMADMAAPPDVYSAWRELDDFFGSTAEIIPVSAATGLGISRLRHSLAGLIAGLEPVGDRPRLWVDRSFSVPGVGTVVTGTLIEGPLSVGDTVEILPTHKTARIRGLQSHESEIALAKPARRLALNLTGVSRSDVPRGSMLGVPHQWRLTNRFTSRITLARYVDVLPARGAFHLHVGTAAYPVTIKREQGEYALLQVSTLLPLRTGDRFILRDTGRKLVMAGGVVIDPAPGSPASAMHSAPRIDPAATPDQIATDLLAVRGVDDVDRLSAQSGGGAVTDAITVGSTVITGDRFQELRAEAERLVAEHHAEHPLRVGLSVATLATSLDIGQNLTERIVEESPTLQRIGPDVTRVDHEQELDPVMKERWEKAEDLLREGLGVPGAKDLGLDPELLHLLIRTGKLVRISDDLVFLPDQLREIVAVIRDMAGPFTVAEFRDRTGLSRKYAVPLLEWSDREGLTIRRGNERLLR